MEPGERRSGQGKEIPIDDVKPSLAQHPIQRRLKRWHRDPQPVEAPGGGQGAELKQPFGSTCPAVSVLNQNDFATEDLHGPAALLNIELVVDEHHRSQIVVLSELGHQPMHPRLCPEARGAGWHLGNAEDVEALWVH